MATYASNTTIKIQGGAFGSGAAAGPDSTFSVGANEYAKLTLQMFPAGGGNTIRLSNGTHQFEIIDGNINQFVIPPGSNVTIGDIAGTPEWAFSYVLFKNTP